MKNFSNNLKIKVNLIIDQFKLSKFKLIKERKKKQLVLIIMIFQFDKSLKFS